MLELINYTTNTAIEIETAYELDDYLEANRDDEIGLGSNEFNLPNLDEARIYLELEEDDQIKFELIGEVCGAGYFKTVEEALSDYENYYFIEIDGASTYYEVAYALDFSECYEYDLYQILACSKDSYEQLGSFITTNTLAHHLEQEYSVHFIRDSAFIQM